jgi:Cu/Zn superoxide dismutase
MKPNPLTVASAAVLLAGLAVPAATAQTDNIAKARATLVSCTETPVVLGSALLVEVPSAEAVKIVEAFISVRGLTPGKHAVHVHEVGACAPCSAAGSHLDLGPFGHNVPVTANHPYHSGDLVNLNVGADGRGSLLATTTRIALTQRPEGPALSVFDANGSSIIIHALPDLYCPDPTDPNCAGGARVACGILEPAN